MNRIEQAQAFGDLLQPGLENEPYEFANLFDDSGFGARRQSKKRFKLLKKIDPALRNMLAEGERVVFMARGMRNSTVEALVIGWVVYYINQYALVVTNKRLLMLQVSRNGAFREFVKQIDFKALKKIKAGWFSGVTVKTTDKSTILFAHVSRSDAKRLRELLDQSREQVNEQHPVEEKLGEQNLCPRCVQVVTGFPGRCDKCGQAFKSASKAALLSLLFPGFGDFYLGHRGFAILEILFAALVWSGVFIPDPDQPADTATLIIAAAIVFVFLHGIDAAITWMIARKGLYPGKNVAAVAGMPT